jgi:hypothetical protein
MDNNAAERSLRAVALGRKNFLFAGSDRGGESAAAIYSLIGTAKLNGIDPDVIWETSFPASRNTQSTALKNCSRGISLQTSPKTRFTLPNQILPFVNTASG